MHFLFVKESTVEYSYFEVRVVAQGLLIKDDHGELTTEKYARGGTVGVSEILAQLDREIAQLQQARALLSGAAAKASKAAAPASKKVAKKKRNLTPEGRKRIADAVKRRWAEQKKAAGGK